MLAVLEALAAAGVRFVMRAADGRAVDAHPVVFDERGDGVQAGFDGARYEYPVAGFGQGRIGGAPVPCLTAEQQLRFHLGYAPTEKDRRDMAVLAERLGLALPDAYQGGSYCQDEAVAAQFAEPDDVDPVEWESWRAIRDEAVRRALGEVVPEA